MGKQIKRTYADLERENKNLQEQVKKLAELVVAKANGATVKPVIPVDDDLWTKERVEAEITKCNEFWEQKSKRQLEAFEKRAQDLADVLDARFLIAEELTKLEVDMLLTTARLDVFAALHKGLPLIVYVTEFLPDLKNQYQELIQRLEEVEMTDVEPPRSMHQVALRIRAMELVVDPEHPEYDEGGENLHLLALSSHPIYADVKQAIQRQQQEIIDAAKAEMEAEQEHDTSVHGSWATPINETRARIKKALQAIRGEPGKAQAGNKDLAIMYATRLEATNESELTDAQRADLEYLHEIPAGQLSDRIYKIMTDDKLDYIA